MSSLPLTVVPLLGLFASLVLRGGVPPGGSPFVVVLDLMLRLLAGVLLSWLVVFAMLMEVEREAWGTPELGVVALLGGWAVAALAGAALLHRWHGTVGALLGQGLVRPHAITTPGAARGLFIAALAIAMSTSMGLVEVALSGAASDLNTAAGTLAAGAVVVGAGLAGAAHAAVRLVGLNDLRMWSPRKLARALHGVPGTWTFTRVTSSAAPGVSDGFRVFVYRGRWYWLAIDMRRLLALREAAIASAEHPAIGLHTHRMTFNPAAGRGSATAAGFGVRVWDPAEIGWLGRWRAHRAERFDDEDYEGLPDAVRGRLVPLGPAALEAAGLQAASVPSDSEWPAVAAPGSRRLQPA